MKVSTAIDVVFVAAFSVGLVYQVLFWLAFAEGQDAVGFGMFYLILWALGPLLMLFLAYTWVLVALRRIEGEAPPTGLIARMRALLGWASCASVIACFLYAWLRTTVVD